MKKLLTLALATSMILALSVNSFALGNYVLSTDELGAEDEVPEEDVIDDDDDDDEDVPPYDPELPEEEVVKANPDTGAEDFVGVAAAAAAIAGVGFVALKRK